jgi:hypothetical protein
LKEKVMQWEYTVLTVGAVDNAFSLEEMLNKKGCEGWELVSAVHVELYKGIIFLKRRKDR